MKVELHQISKRFGNVRANERISLTIAPNTIHGLVGENGAGKTTLVSILAGYIKKDSGRILVNGEEYDFSSPRKAAARGIGMLHQDPMDVPVFSALENFMLGRVRGLAQKRKRFLQTFLALSQRLGFSLSPRRTTAAMTPGARQQLDIVRLLSAGTRLLILDEPTTGLAEDQKATLFQALRRFVAEQGNSVVLVSHKIADIQQLCDRMTVLRQGVVSGSLTAPFDADRILELMFGEHVVRTVRPSRRYGETVFAAAGIAGGGKRTGLSPVDLTLRRGEIVGLAGIEGSGQETFLKIAAGLLAPSAGRLFFKEKNITGCGYHLLKKKGIGYMPADRLNEGLAPELTIAEHFLVAESGPLFKKPSPRALQRADEAIARFQIKGDRNTPVRALSGGNQQRLLLALIPDTAEVLFLDKPTRGLDPESAAMVWSGLQSFCDKGGAVFFSSPDLDELLSLADRIAVFFNGRLTADLSVTETSLNILQRAITGKGVVPSSSKPYLSDQL